MKVPCEEKDASTLDSFGRRREASPFFWTCIKVVFKKSVDNFNIEVFSDAYTFILSIVLSFLHSAGFFFFSLCEFSFENAELLSRCSKQNSPMKNACFKQTPRPSERTVEQNPLIIISQTEPGELWQSTLVEKLSAPSTSFHGEGIWPQGTTQTTNVFFPPLLIFRE